MMFDRESQERKRIRQSGVENRRRFRQRLRAKRPKVAGRAGLHRNLKRHALPLDIQRSIQAELPCAPIFTLDSDHSPFFSKPDELVNCLLSVAAQIDPK